MPFDVFRDAVLTFVRPMSRARSSTSESPRMKIMVWTFFKVVNGGTKGEEGEATRA